MGQLLKNRRGFTLIELMLVVAVVGILSSVALPLFTETILKAYEGSTKGNLGTLRSAMSIYYGDTDGRYPNTPNVLTSNAKYLRKIPAAYTSSHGSQNSITLGP